MSTTTKRKPATAIEIKNRWNGKILIRDEESGSLKDAVVKAIANRADLRGAYLSDADLSDAYLSGADLSGADLSDADLSDAYLRGAYLSGADLSGADLSDADLRGAYLSGADLSGADLSDADLSDAYLRGAYLSGADLSGADLSDADLSDADLSGAYLRGADLSGAYLSGADLSGADLSDADLSGAKGIDANGKPVDLTDADYIELRDSFRARHPEVPIVPLLDSTICKIVNSGEGELKMSTWHTCETAHCRAGWAIHLAGKAGYELEEKYDSYRAGAMIYRAATGRIPNFFTSDDEALSDICEWGAKETAAVAPN